MMAAKPDRFTWMPGDVRASLCMTCVHTVKGPTCEAFPAGIPQPFLNGSAEHRKPYPGDHGIQYEKRP